MTSVPRYSANENRRVPVACPKAVKSYNTFMGGTDKNGQMTCLQRCRRHYKWPRRLMMKIFMWSACNAYVLMGFHRPHNQPNQRLYTFHNFIEQLCLELVGDVRNETTLGRRRSDAAPELRLNRGPHEAERSHDGSRNHRCVVCCEKNRRAKLANPNAPDKDLPIRSKTIFWCSYCREYL